LGRKRAKSPVARTSKRKRDADLGMWTETMPFRKNFHLAHPGNLQPQRMVVERAAGEQLGRNPDKIAGVPDCGCCAPSPISSRSIRTRSPLVEVQQDLAAAERCHRPLPVDDVGATALAHLDLRNRRSRPGGLSGPADLAHNLLDELPALGSGGLRLLALDAHRRHLVLAVVEVHLEHRCSGARYTPPRRTGRRIEEQSAADVRRTGDPPHLITSSTGGALTK
jgi:hypothetical protein